MPEPDFLGVGAHLGGTLWWRTLLADHPQVDLRRSREETAPFWDAFCARAMTDADVAAYRERFAGAAPGALVGEWSDRYLYNAWMLPLLQRAAPDAKLLFLARDPTDRYRTTLRYRVGERGGEDATIHMSEAFHRGRYASQLRALERFFGRDRILVQQYERCVADPLGEYRRMLRFLGLDETHVPRAIGRPPRRPDEVRFPALRRLAGRRVPAPVELWPDIERALTAALQDEVAALADRVDLRLWPAFAHLAPAGAAPPAPPVPVPAPRARDRLRRVVAR